ncbi:MAG: glycosyltransferase [Caldilinea sp. CFX5]|nr:glycosyltransferase [Caldilinea sp. CFX5]
MRLGCFIITFNRPNILKTTIQTILSQTQPPECILVIDNGDASATAEVLREFDHTVIMHHPLGNNLGPAAAEAFGLNWFCEQGYDWVYWVDDDNPPIFPDTLKRLLAIVPRLDRIEDVGGVAAVGQLFDWKQGQVKRLSDAALQGIIDVDVVGGGSQFILRCEAVKNIALPDERLFIDFEDTEYCLRLRRAGYRLLVDGDFMHLHRESFGRLNHSAKKKLNLSKQLTSPWRQYYSTRNYIYAMQSTFGRPDLARRKAAKSVVRGLAAWVHGINYGLAFSRLQWRAVVDGYRGRLGRTVLPKPKY